MSDSRQPDNDNDFPEIETDPEILALLDFEPVVRKVVRASDGWNPERQREFIRRLARCGSPFHAVTEMGKNLSGIEALYRAKGADSFRAAWDEAKAIGLRRTAEQEPAGEAYFGPVPGITRRGTPPPRPSSARLSPGQAARFGPLKGEGEEGQVLNEHGEWEDEGSLHRRAEDARDHISNKLLYARRLYLMEICSEPAKRAAFEILTDLPVDWDKASRNEPQPDEPWRQVNLREPDMLMTAENGWMPEMTRGGPDKKAELIRVINGWLVENGREPV
jgi:hypothetical protein